MRCRHPALIYPDPKSRSVPAIWLDLRLAHDPPHISINGWEEGVALGSKIDMAYIEPARSWHQRLVKGRAAADHDLIGAIRRGDGFGMLERSLEVADHDHALGLVACLTGNDNIRPARQGPAYALEGLAPHDQGLAKGCALEEGEVGRQVPWDRVAGADDIVSAHGGNHRDDRAHWRASACSASPSTRHLVRSVWSTAPCDM